MDDLLLLGEIKALPKIELHRHLEGSIRLTTMVEIAEQFGIEMPEYEIETLRPFVQVVPGEYRSDKTFLGKFKTIRQFFLSTEIIARMAREAVEDAANDNIKYMELRFTPKALCNICKCTPHEVVSLVCDTVASASAEFGIQTRLIVSINRHEGFDIAEQALQAALAHRERGVVGFDMGGDEAAYPASLFLDLFRRAKAEGMRITLHAGEWEGAQSVWDAVGNLGAERIGHGIKALEDPGVIAVLVGRGIVLEVCPSSNVDSGIVSELGPILPELIKSGVKVTLNTDDPLISNITLSDEIFRAVQHMGLTLDDVKELIMIAARAAFLNGEEHTALVNQFRTWLYTNDSPRKTPDVMLQIGDIKIHTINDGDTLVDPGGAFGLVPRALWRSYFEPDAQHMIPMIEMCLLVQVAGQNIVIDTGMGNKLDEKRRAIWHLSRPRGDLIAALGRLNLTPEDITLVIDTHLHADHCSGNTRFADDGQTVVATFPNADYVVQRREYEDAITPNERTAGTYYAINWQVLVENGQMRLLDGDTELAPGVWGVVTRGHTPGHMSVRFESQGQYGLFVCDMASYAVHFEKIGWMTAYDVEPLHTLENKRRWQQWALDHDAVLIFPHDPKRPVGRLARDEKGRPVVVPIDEPFV